MILNNYWRALNIIKDIVFANGTKDYGLYDTNGNSIGAIWYGGDGAVSGIRNIERALYNVRLRNDHVGIVIGKGEGSINAADYSLFDDCTAGFSNITTNFIFTNDNDAFNQIIDINASNNSGSAITVTEIGITKNFYTSSNAFSNPVLLAKMQLDTPIIVPAGGTFHVLVNWIEQ